MPDATYESLLTSHLGPVPESLLGENPAGAVYRDLLVQHPALGPCLPQLLKAHLILASAFRREGALYLCGNGGSFSDALHISGELTKSYLLDRTVGKGMRERLEDLPYGADLCELLEEGLPAVVLGANGALGSAVLNDRSDAGLVFAQELYALGAPGDVLLAISTSGGSRNVRMAVSVAKAKGISVIALTGPGPNPLAEEADHAICAPGEKVFSIQENHVILYHALCSAIEAEFFGDHSG
ncbi:MAG: D-sedoheptulose-7-phosphate isomerase [Planctomycetota bacterium]|jgi:phosphoheptose isomerase